MNTLNYSLLDYKEKHFINQTEIVNEGHFGLH